MFAIIENRSRSQSLSDVIRIQGWDPERPSAHLELSAAVCIYLLMNHLPLKANGNNVTNSLLLHVAIGPPQF